MFNVLCGLVALAVATEAEKESIPRTVALTILGAVIYDDLKGAFNGKSNE